MRGFNQVFYRGRNVYEIVVKLQFVTKFIAFTVCTQLPLHAYQVGIHTLIGRKKVRCCMTKQAIFGIA